MRLATPPPPVPEEPLQESPLAPADDKDVPLDPEVTPPPSEQPR
ncbi:hypothetical protein [Comamonas endophytica]|uniref:Stereocilin n=1 Tax=Comamonas endophytica TaxID=2949090 RepID=A0ABY6GF38_9BURK|nr:MULTISPECIES: hypothetical protein [unclassified Acidovorax]UYG53705.1 hypothetical protein M9799_17365 [Acidovorax sp. 5MLIR]